MISRAVLVCWGRTRPTSSNFADIISPHIQVEGLKFSAGFALTQELLEMFSNEEPLAVHKPFLRASNTYNS